MSTHTLIGPLRLEERSVNLFIPEQRTGVYVTGKNLIGFAPLKVGKSELHLRQALLNEVGTHSAFKFFVTPTLEEAFDFECRIWHEYEPKDNPEHPVMEGKVKVACPVCGKGGDDENGNGKDDNGKGHEKNRKKSDPLKTTKTIKDTTKR